MINQKINKFEHIFSAKDRVQHVKKMFAKIAPRYDLLNHIMSIGRDIAWRRLAIKRADFKMGSRILDLGIGTGDMAVQIFKQVKACQVIGLDNCNELIKIGKKKSGLQKTHWIIGDGRILPFKDCYFDGIVAAFSVRNLRDFDILFNELNRVLYSDGKLVILDMVKPKGVIYSKIFQLQFQYIAPIIGKMIGSDPDAYQYLLPSVEKFFSADELANELSNYGFKMYDLKQLMFKTVVIYMGRKLK